MANLEATGTLVLVLALGAVAVMVLLVRSRRTNRDLPIWLASTVVGILIGAAGTAALATGLGYKISKTVPEDRRNTTSPAMGMGGGPMPGMGGPPGTGRGGGPGMGMMGGRTPPKIQLATFVRKIELLTGDIQLKLSPEQSATMATMLDELKANPTLTDAEANAKYEKLLAVLDDSQKAKHDSIRLPFRGFGRGGGPGGPGGGPPGGPGGPGGGPPGGRGGNPAPDANPFSEEENSKALSNLLNRLGGTKPLSESTEK